MYYISSKDGIYLTASTKLSASKKLSLIVENLPFIIIEIGEDFITEFPFTSTTCREINNTQK